MLRIGDLANKAILVTGASSGIGAAISRAFAEQGARVAVHWSGNAAGAEQVAQDIRASGGFAQLVRGDLTVAGEAKRVVEDSAELLGGLDVLINNAGSLVSRRPFLDTDDEWMDSVFDLNARAVSCRPVKRPCRTWNGAAAAQSSTSDPLPVLTAAAAARAFTARRRPSCTI